MLNAQELLNIARSEIGVKEEPPASNKVKYADWYGAKELYGYYVPWCFGGDVEILTENGFIPFEHLPRGLKVAQVDPRTLELSLVQPTRYIEKDYEGRLLECQKRSLKGLVVDPSHRFFGDWKRKDRMGVKGDWGNELFPVDNLFNGESSQLSIPAYSGSSNNKDRDISDEDLQLIAIFLADGFIHKGKIEVSCSKIIKKNFFKSLNPVNVYNAKKAYGERTKQPLTHFTWDKPQFFEEAFDSYKCLSPKFCWSLSKRQAGIIVDTFTFLDGSLDGKTCNRGQVNQSRKEIIDSLHLLTVISGRTGQTQKPRKSGEFGSTIYGFSFSDKNQPTILQSKNFTERQGKQKLYCVSVPSSLIVVRPKYGKAIITGNCAIFVCWIFHEAGMSIPKIQHEKGFANCPDGVNWFKQNARFHRKNPRPGDIVFFDWGRDGVADHVGIVEEVYPTYIKTIEGNTSTSNQSNGGQVMRRTRYYPSIQGYGRMQFAYDENSYKIWDGNYLQNTKRPVFSEKVVYLQKKLNTIGANLIVDGYYGSKTAQAVRDAQTQLGIEVDGVVGAQTWSRLFT